MKFPNLNDQQKFIVDNIKEKIGTEFTEKWFYLRNKNFKDRAPIDFLLSENYEYFNYIVDETN